MHHTGMRIVTRPSAQLGELFMAHYVYFFELSMNRN